ncbi:hypothetical protein C173_17256 [Paenibacillus sp. FSL R7-277]|nr:hypothetical protein C173_17256 [Paenibacillus sp. FSL R7-277]
MDLRAFKQPMFTFGTVMLMIAIMLMMSAMIIKSNSLEFVFCQKTRTWYYFRFDKHLNITSGEGSSWRKSGACRLKLKRQEIEIFETCASCRFFSVERSEWQFKSQQIN